MRLTRADIVEGSAAVFDLSDERLAPAREEQRRDGTFEGKLRLAPKGGAPFEAVVSVASGAAGVKAGAGPEALAVVGFVMESRVPAGLGEEWSRSPLHHSPDVVALYEADRTLRYISPSVEDVLGYSPGELVGRVTRGLVYPEDVERLIDQMVEARGVSGAGWPVAFRARHKDGGWRRLEAVPNDLFDDPRVGGMMVHFRDITARLEELEERYLLYVDGSSVGIAHVTPEGRLLRANERFCAITGRPREELMALSSLHAVVHPDDREACRLEMEKAARGETGASSSERRYVKGDGSVASWVSSRVQRAKGMDDLPGHLVVLVEDVSQRKEAELVWGSLSAREKEVLGMVVLGTSNRDIAGALHVSIHTVKYHVRGVLRKLGVSDRTRAAARAAALGLFPPAPSNNAR